MSTISIEIKDELKAQLETEAEAQGISLNELIEKILSDFIHSRRIKKAFSPQKQKN